ncbi:hypothetical protein [Mucilaginibacter flavidus]|uniref:hypothetical protein n=1 Tax=Mucilaginibacter flavidus TaxID=2949309 RepID=UPI002091E81B|nr:hypothetical protein [Mucilaginibacter flavidus]MCO5949859.1 hypothetical protein [Mucilaginibacter flavidus]
MKVLLLIYLLQMNTQAVQTLDIGTIRKLYHSAANVKQDALHLNQLMLGVDNTAPPVLVCYKGANEMIQAKYALNPIVKLTKFNKGKALLIKAIGRDTLNLEMRFIRYSIQSNLPAFLNYNDELDADKRFLVDNTKNNRDPELREIIYNYLTTQPGTNRKN